MVWTAGRARRVLNATRDESLAHTLIYVARFSSLLQPIANPTRTDFC
jgi:hypothetical protein